MAIFKGRNAQLLLQRQSAFRTAPSPAAAFRMKFMDLDISDSEDYSDDATIDNSSPLMVKRGDTDEAWTAKVTAPLDLNDIGQWLALLWGAPTTTGTGPYVHTFTLGLNDRPDALLELGLIDATLYRRWLSTVLNTMSWSIVDKDQNISLDLVPAVEVVPRPGSAFDAAPTAYAKNRACKKGGKVEDVSGASTIGRITAADITITNDHESFQCADGLSGYGAHSLGQPGMSGKLSGLFASDSSILTKIEAHTSLPLILTSANAAGDNTLVVTVPNAELGKPKHVIPNSKGLLIETDWRAHSGGAAPTIVLTNGIASYAA